MVNCTKHINNFLQKNKLSEAQELFDLMIEKQVEPDAYTYNTLMKGYSAVGNSQRVNELFKDMEERGVKPSIITFNTAIRSHAIDGDLEGAQCFVKKMKDGIGLEPDAYTYSALLDVCVNARDLETARSLFDEMNASGIKQDKVTMTTMIDVYAECCNEENGEQYLENCRELIKEMERKEVIANIQTYNTLLKLCTRGELTVNAMSILDKIRANHMQPNIVSYNTVLDGISKDQKLSHEEVLTLSSKIINEMKEEEIPLNTTTYNSLISVALRLEDLQLAVQMFKEMKTVKVKPDYITYGIMIKCYEKLGDLENGDAYLKPCLELLEECRKAGMKLTEEGYTSLLSACAKVSDLDQALKIWNRLIKNKLKLSVSVYNAMINVCLSKGNEDMAFDFLDQMKTSGIQCTVITYGTFLSYFVKKKDITGAEKIHAEMKTRGVKPDKAILRIMKAMRNV